MWTDGTRRIPGGRDGVSPTAGYTVLEVAVVVVIFLLMTAAVGTAFGTGGEVYGDGMFRADLNAKARHVMNRILAEVEETQSDSPDFAVGSDFITYNRVVSISAMSATFGPQRTITIDASEEIITLTIAGAAGTVPATEELTGHATGLGFVLDGSRLTVTVSITKTNAHGTPITQTVTGDVNVHR